MGDHGYYNNLTSMHPFMAAAGPGFHKDLRIRGLQSVDIYPLMCHLLTIPPQPNNGSLAEARCLLVGETCSRAPLLIALVIAVLLVLATTLGKSKWPA